MAPLRPPESPTFRVNSWARAPVHLLVCLPGFLGSYFRVISGKPFLFLHHLAVKEKAADSRLWVVSNLSW
jgi:hypothetical protein